MFQLETEACPVSDRIDVSLIDDNQHTNYYQVQNQIYIKYIHSLKFNLKCLINLILTNRYRIISFV